jgi:hypothetical protein
MTNSNRRQSLINARRACEWLREYAAEECASVILRYNWQREEIACLISEFTRLDSAERAKLDNINKRLHKRKWSEMSQADLVLLLGDIARLVDDGRAGHHK